MSIIEAVFAGLMIIMIIEIVLLSRKIVDMHDCHHNFTKVTGEFVNESYVRCRRPRHGSRFVFHARRSG